MNDKFPGGISVWYADFLAMKGQTGCLIKGSQKEGAKKNHVSLSLVHQENTWDMDPICSSNLIRLNSTSLHKSSIHSLIALNIEHCRGRLYCFNCIAVTIRLLVKAL